ncbi:hypothetical protein [Microbacterium plantarum]|uniref:hypothetical protein n=1 Tax=Microbacterium plantarum TaxID=1816425 RepID=UPI002B495F1C|nr:hypothetical protein [Microbacterium plantarum]WRK16140.1 hypothetical protein VC184_09420 [Microbacterium plantarum]
MSITIQVELPVVDVEVTNDYTVAVTVTDPLTHTTATVSLDQEQTAEFIGMLQVSKAEALSAYWEDRRARPVTRIHGFDTDGPVHPECRQGKCGNCDGQTMDGRDQMVPCTHGCHAGGQA